MKFEKPLVTLAAATAFAVGSGELAGRAEAKPSGHNTISQRKLDACNLAAQKLLLKAKQWPGVVIFHAPTKGHSQYSRTYECPKSPADQGAPPMELSIHRGHFDAVAEADPYIAVDRGRTYLFAPDNEDNHYSMIDVGESVAEGAVDFYAYKGSGTSTKPMPNKFNAFRYEWHPDQGKVTSFPNAIDALWMARHLHPKYGKNNIVKTKNIPHL